MSGSGWSLQQVSQEPARQGSRTGTTETTGTDGVLADQDEVFALTAGGARPGRWCHLSVLSVYDGFPETVRMGPLVGEISG